MRFAATKKNGGGDDNITYQSLLMRTRVFNNVFGRVSKREVPKTLRDIN